ALSVNGKIEMPLEKTFWGALYGAFTDQFGIKWMVNCQLEEG
ncbi:MAG: VOC family protein, partial [Acinetobacter sp.]